MDKIISDRPQKKNKKCEENGKLRDRSRAKETLNDFPVEGNLNYQCTQLLGHAPIYKIISEERELI